MSILQMQIAKKKRHFPPVFFFFFTLALCFYNFTAKLFILDGTILGLFLYPQFWSSTSVQQSCNIFHDGRTLQTLSRKRFASRKIRKKKRKEENIQLYLLAKVFTLVCLSSTQEGKDEVIARQSSDQHSAGKLQWSRIFFCDITKDWDPEWHISAHTQEV